MSASRSKNDGGNGRSPSPEAIVALAEHCGYVQRREMVSATLFFVELDPPHGMPPARINIYPTTRSIMTHLNHPNSGSNELWRSNAYDNIDELRSFFLNPRMHSGKGYRNADKAVRGCVRCGEMKKRTDFSRNQWTKGPDANKCKTCAESGGAAVPDLTRSLAGLDLGASRGTAVPDLTRSLEGLDIGDAPTLTEDLLRAHDNETKPVASERSERRQFNCPDCPKYGRGSFVFFKKVPSMKPIVKCPQCKKASRGKCKRLYPIPREAERGYGLFRCENCGDKWGSSRAVANIGQECFSCRERGEGSVMVTPFRLEVVKKNKGRSDVGGGTGGRGMKRVPKEPIREDSADERAYGDADRQRNFSGASNALAGGRDGGMSTRSYDIQPREDDRDARSKPVQAPLRPTRTPRGYRHKCAGCASGVCKSRKVPKSEVHDISDGNTASTTASAVTNSSVDKSEYVDRDEDFSGFEDDGEGEWIKV